MNVAFSVLYLFLLTFYLQSGNRMLKEHKIDFLLVFGLVFIIEENVKQTVLELMNVPQRAKC